MAPSKDVPEFKSPGRYGKLRVCGPGICQTDYETAKVKDSVLDANFSFVGAGRGGYAPVDSYDFKGEGHGDFKKITHVHYTSCKPRNSAYIALAVVLGGALLYFGARSLSTSGDAVQSYASDGAFLDKRFDCTVLGAADPAMVSMPSNAGQIVLDSVWQRIDPDGDNVVALTVITSAMEPVLSPTSLILAADADINGDGSLTRDEFLPALLGAGMAAAPQRGSRDVIEAYALAEAAFLVSDTNGNGQVTVEELHGIAPTSFSAEKPEVQQVFETLSQQMTAHSGGFSRDDFVAVLMQGSTGPIRVLEAISNPHNFGPDCWSSEQRRYCCQTAEIGCTIAAPALQPQAMPTASPSTTAPPASLPPPQEPGTTKPAPWAASEDAAAGLPAVAAGGFQPALQVPLAAAWLPQAPPAVAGLPAAATPQAPAQAAVEQLQAPAAAATAAVQAPTPASSVVPGQQQVEDCEAGLAAWQTLWSADKKAWCCTHERVGCES
mmetsp:Transcript_82498/g.267245  ORF Transcript_82498/g.267245 Transcript_82498/m.267245 type:complete len:493 (+) Transcript_82498:75-1553(+)|eukprot:CAMPEP_0203977326 /NCGR_PEP_ID=MMETSP0359-20131031/101557_1 /ASSEMBLY_ACC=CAM_ASM_000338 /TAXON_ID=268821 /ORGANISM="Scrippsiella Hangoei, Strain SHTV-5" /LENGTH=492 /DNA_ID=CAMNT_0050915535 /DNA_START=40 /DNA_END=1518 /DNA_ORIENTATION=-